MGWNYRSPGRPRTWWRLRGGYTYFRKRIHFGDSQDINRGRSEGNDPHHQLLIQSMINLPGNLELDSVLRYVDNLNQRRPDGAELRLAGPALRLAADCQLGIRYRRAKPFGQKTC